MYIKVWSVLCFATSNTHIVIGLGQWVNSTHGVFARCTKCVSFNAILFET